MERIIVTINAKNKEEAKRGLEMAMEAVSAYHEEYSGSVHEHVIVTNEGKEE